MLDLVPHAVCLEVIADTPLTVMQKQRDGYGWRESVASCEDHIQAPKQESLT